MTHLPRLPLRIAAAVALSAVALTACGSSKPSTSPPAGGGAGSSSGASAASVPGVTDTSVTIGSHQPLTGVAAPGYSEIAPASKAYFDFVNAQGGVNGRKISYIFKDDMYNPTQTVSVVRDLVQNQNVFAIFNGLGTPTHNAAADFLNTQKVPDLFVASGCLCWNEPQKRPETFGWQPDYTVEGKILGQYVKQTYVGKKIAYFTQNDDFGQNGIKGLDTQIPKDQVISRQTYTSGNIDVSPQVSALKAANPDVVVAFTVPAYTALLKLTALKVGFNPTIVVSNVGADLLTLQGLITKFGKGAVPPNVLDGLVSDSYLPIPTDMSNSYVQLFRKVHDADPNVSKLPFDGNVEYGMAVAYTFVQALQKAGKNLTRAGLVSAVEQGGFTGPGLVPFRFSPTDHSGYAGVQVAVVKNNVPTLTGPVLVTDDGSGAITEYTQKQPEAPSNGVPTG